MLDFNTPKTVKLFSTKLDNWINKELALESENQRQSVIRAKILVNNKQAKFDAFLADTKAELDRTATVRNANSQVAQELLQELGLAPE